MFDSYKTSTLFHENYYTEAHTVINQGGSGSGKTYAIIQVLFCIACENSGMVITVVSQDIPNLKAGAIRDALTIYAESGQFSRSVRSYNKSDRVFEFNNGSTRHSPTANGRHKNRQNHRQTNKTLFNDQSIDARKEAAIKSRTDFSHSIRF